MKTLDTMTLAELQQKLEMIEIQLKLLLSSYKDFVKKFLSWESDDVKKKDKKASQQLTNDFKLIMDTLLHYCDDISRAVSSVDRLVEKVALTKSQSMMKAMESNLFKIDEVLLRCNTNIYLIEESSAHIYKGLGLPIPPKKLLN